jgi:hypothetical protein
VALVALVLALFLLVQLLWTWRTEGAMATLVSARQALFPRTGMRVCTYALKKAVRRFCA